MTIQKYVLIPAAVFMLTATAASAFSSDIINKLDLDLTDTQTEALEEAHALKAGGAERSEVRAFLAEAGFERTDLREVKSAVREYHQTVRTDIKAAVSADDYEAFLAVAADTKLGEVVDTEAEFDRLVEAYELKEAGDKDGAKEIMAELGIERPERDHDRGQRTVQ